MSADVPMRERRGELRENGYSFRQDNIGHSFIGTLRLTERNLIAPPSSVPVIWSQPIVELPNGRFLIGEKAGKGLILQRSNSRLQVYERTCAHEGALLDTASQVSDCLRCPWHGKLVKPLATLDLDDVNSQYQDGEISVSLKDGTLLVLVSPA